MQKYQEKHHKRRLSASHIKVEQTTLLQEGRRLQDIQIKRYASDQGKHLPHSQGVSTGNHRVLKHFETVQHRKDKGNGETFH